MRHPLIAAGLLWSASMLQASVPGDIGLERGPVAVVLPRDDYVVAARDDRTALILRIESVKPAPGDRFAYTFRSVGFEAGDILLADYLTHPDGTPATELGDSRIKVTGILSPDFNGRLNDFTPATTPWFGGYRPALTTVAALWLAALPALVLIGRKRKIVAAPAPIAPEPTRAERMRPLVIAASEGRLDTAGSAELERLMTGHWRETLQLSGERMGDIIAAMRRHPEAGPLLSALERWLHDPKGAAPGEIDTLLAPYARTPEATEKEGAR